MSRPESKMVMGYLPIEEKHWPAIISLVAPATPAHRIIDPFAGKGEFLEAGATGWNMTPYANELDGDRAAECVSRFGATQAVRCDVERLIASTGAFSLGWFNPPYDHDATGDAENKRIEFKYLKHAWKWVQQGGLVMWCVYHQHLTQHAAKFLSTNSTQVDVWALPGKHQGEYDQIVVVARVGIPLHPLSLFEDIMKQRQNPRPLVMQAESLYKLPPPPTVNQFRFMPDVLEPEDGLKLVSTNGAWNTNGFQSLLAVPPVATEIEPVVAPRPGHMALVLAAGIADGAIIETEEYGTVALRGKTQLVEEVARVEIEENPNDPEHNIKKTTMRLKPTTTISLVGTDGKTVEMTGDKPLLEFIGTNKKALVGYLNRKFKPMYNFDFNGMGSWLKNIRLNGKYPLYRAQQHVIAAVVRGFESRKGILLVGQMGTGKTAMGGAAAIAIGAGVVAAMKTRTPANKVILLVAPPHLIGKWERELRSISKNVFTARLDRHEDVKAFMEKADLLGSGVAKIGLIKRDMTKLHCATETAVVWSKKFIALWKKNAAVPKGFLPTQRIQTTIVPRCPCCGQVIYERSVDDELIVASKDWLEKGRRTCTTCQSPLWQEARDRASRPKPGEKYAPKNPRYRLDVIFKRLYADRVAGLLWDEAHEAQHGDTGNGEAFGRFANIAGWVLAQTGSPFNGRASSIFNLEYFLNERTRVNYPWGGADRLCPKSAVKDYKTGNDWQIVISDSRNQRGYAESLWVANMGIREQILEDRPSYNSNTGAYTGTTTYARPYEEAPGISPLLVAEVLDHAIFFALADLGKALPKYEEIAVPVELDNDVWDEYDRTRTKLKDYLISRRWEGDATFRGAYLQWAMGWHNSTFRPYEVIHNLKHPITKGKMAHTVRSIPSFGEDRFFAKEEALVDLINQELESNPTRPVVVYVRQTSTRDIQPRLKKVIDARCPKAKTYILPNTVAADRREKTIERQIAAGVNVILCNPELVKTGLDLIYFPTLIFYEIVFNLSTLMQASARAYRLNQTHLLCKTYYMYAEGTMEHSAVQLMSRKQRAAKLLTGDIGLSGLDELTQGEGSFEQALLNAIGRDEALVDASQMFKTEAAIGEIDVEDAAYWRNDEEDDADHPAPESDTFNMLLEMAHELGAVISPVASRKIAAPAPTLAPKAAPPEMPAFAYLPDFGAPVAAEQPIALPVPQPMLPVVAAPAPAAVAKHPIAIIKAVVEYLDSVRILPISKHIALRGDIMKVLATGTLNDVAAKLAEHHGVFPGFEMEVAAKLVALYGVHAPAVPTSLPERVENPPPQAAKPVAMPTAAPKVSAPAKNGQQTLFGDLMPAATVKQSKPTVYKADEPFATKNPKEQWYMARAQLQIQLDSASFKSVDALELVNVEDNTYHFTVQRIYALNQLQGTLGRELLRVLRDVTGKAIKIDFKLVEKPADMPAPNKSEQAAMRGAYYQQDIERYGQPKKTDGMETFNLPKEPTKMVVWVSIGGTQYRQSISNGQVVYVVEFINPQSAAA